MACEDRARVLLQVTVTYNFCFFVADQTRKRQLLFVTGLNAIFYDINSIIADLCKHLFSFVL